MAARISAMGLETEPARVKLFRYATLLLDWNRNVSNLVSRNDEERFIDRHIGESLLVAEQALQLDLDSWLDLGSGGGLPAIPLALLGLGKRWTLVESRRMKTLFLRKAVEELGLKHVEIVCDRLENRVERAKSTGPEYDAFTSRATLRLAPTLELAATFVRSGGTAFLWKGERLADEMSAPEAWSADWTQGETVPSADTPTVVISFRRN